MIDVDDDVTPILMTVRGRVYVVLAGAVRVPGVERVEVEYESGVQQCEVTDGAWIGQLEPFEPDMTVRVRWLDGRGNELCAMPTVELDAHSGPISGFQPVA